MFRKLGPIAIFLLFSILVIVGVYTTRKPLCIESRVVERIDRVDKKIPLDSIYRCAYLKDGGFSLYFFESLSSLNKRINSIERVLENIEPFSKKLQITVSKDRPYMFNIKGQALLIGEELLRAPGHLEKGIAKIWLNEKRKHYFTQQNLLEESITDFLVFLSQGDLDIGDPETKVVTRLQRVRWPYILKSVPSYCETPWKKSEHYSVCRNKNSSEPLMDELVIEASLRPLLSYAWIEAYRKISLRDRSHFVKSLVLALKDEPIEKLPLIPTTLIEGNLTSLAKASEAIRNISLFLTKSAQIQKSDSYAKFVKEYLYQVKVSGYEEGKVEATFDLLYISRKDLKFESAIVQDFVKVSIDNPGMQVAVQDSKNLWILPSKHAIDVRSFGSMRAHKAIMEKCGDYSVSDLLEMSNNIDKLLLVDNCAEAGSIRYGSLLDKGIENFAIENPQRKFIQLHLPSLQMKKDVLKSAGNIWDFIKKRDVDHEAFSSLGWSEVLWVDSAKAYKPKAAIEAIEWFRVEE